MTKDKKDESWKKKRRRAALRQQKALESLRARREQQPRGSKGWSRRRGLAAALVVLCLMVVVAYAAWQSGDSGSDRRKLAPVFTLTDVDGKAFSLSNFTGKVVVLDFFFVQCPSCDDEMLHLQEIYGSYARDDVEVVSISIRENTVSNLREYREGPNTFSDLTYRVDWILARDTEAANVIGEYGISGYPTVVIVDQEGYISPRSPFVGADEGSVQALSQEIDRLLAG